MGVAERPGLFKAARARSEGPAKSNGEWFVLMGLMAGRVRGCRDISTARELRNGRGSEDAVYRTAEPLAGREPKLAILKSRILLRITGPREEKSGEDITKEEAASEARVFTSITGMVQCGQLRQRRGNIGEDDTSSAQLLVMLTPACAFNIPDSRSDKERRACCPCQQACWVGSSGTGNKETWRLCSW